MSYKLIAIDLDDTLLNDSLEISKENIKALSYASDKGVKIVFCTGRSSRSLQPFLNKVDFFDSENDYFISYNGAVVSTLGGVVLIQNVIKEPILHELIDLGRSEEVDIQLYSETDLIVERRSERIMNYESMTGTVALVLDDLKKCDTSIKVLFNSLDIKKLEKMKAKIELLYSTQVNVFFSKKTYLEVLQIEANKGLALELLANHLHISNENIIAIGDSENDSYMIRYAGLGVSMINGRQSVKSIAQYVTEKTNNENGVAEVIYRYI